MTRKTSVAEIEEAVRRATRYAADEVGRGMPPVELAGALIFAAVCLFRSSDSTLAGIDAAIDYAKEMAHDFVDEAEADGEWPRPAVH